MGTRPTIDGLSVRVKYGTLTNVTTKNPVGREHVNLRLATTGMDRIRAIAAEHNTSISEVIRLAIKYGLEKAESEVDRRSNEL